MAEDTHRALREKKQDEANEDPAWKGMLTRSRLQSEKDKAKYERHAAWKGNKWVVGARVAANLIVGNQLGAAKAYSDYKSFSAGEDAFAEAEAKARAQGLKDFEFSEAEKAAMYAEAQESGRGMIAKSTATGAATGGVAGSVVPGIGTGIGAIVGGAIGFGTGAFKKGQVTSDAADDIAQARVGASIKGLVEGRNAADTAAAKADSQAAQTLYSQSTGQQKTTGGMLGQSYGMQPDDPLLTASDGSMTEWDRYRRGY
jgi:hypothetical protein